MPNMTTLNFANFRTPVQVLIAFVFTMTSLLARAEVPKVFWHSQPVGPNETVMVQGHAISLSTKVDTLRMEDTYPGSPLPVTAPQFDSLPRRIKPLSFGESILNFTIPKNWPNGVYAYRLSNEVQSAVYLVNAPDPWFIHGDQGNRATPGGWVTVYGNSLAINGGTPQLALSKNGTVVKQIQARPGSDNAYAQYFDLPADLAVDSYELYVHNGYGGPAAWSRFPGNDATDSNLLKIVSRDSLWETAARRQNEVVIDSANGLGGAANWDTIFANAIATVKAYKQPNGMPSGGVIRVKPGVYILDRRLVLPDKTILAGTSNGTTILQWGDSSAPETAGRNPLVSGEVLVPYPLTRGTFSIEDITLSRISPNRLGVCIERAFTRTDEQSAWFRRIVCREPNTAATARTVFSPGDWGISRFAVWIYETKNTEITDSILDMAAAINLVGHDAPNEFVRIENNTLRWRVAPLSVLYGLKNLIYANNTELMLGTEAENGTGADADVGDFIGSFSHNNRDVYFAQNQMKREGSDIPYAQLGFTLDGNAGIYVGKITAVAGTRINLAGRTSTPDQYGRKRALPGAMVQILKGKGAGQWRHLMSPILETVNGVTQGVTSIDIDQPWDVEPDANSWLSINDFQGRMIFYGNNFENAPKFQPYFASHDVIVVGNLFGTGRQAANVPVWIGYRSEGYGSMTHGWHYQVLDNTIGIMGASMGTVVRSLDNGERLQPQYGSYPGYDGSYVSTHIYRNNHNAGPSSFVIAPGDQNTGFLVENNSGLSSLMFNEPPFKQEIGLVRNNSSPEGNRPQLFESSAYRYPTYPGNDVTLSYTNNTVVNLARSGVASGIADFGGYARINPIDGNTSPFWGNPSPLAASGVANQPWLQVDVRTSEVIRAVNIWPRLDANAETADVYVTVSPTPFLSNDLDTELARPEVFSQFVPGKLTGVTTVVLPTYDLLNPYVRGGFVGRYVRVWKKFPVSTTGQVILSEIEVMGCTVRPYGMNARACPVN